MTIKTLMQPHLTQFGNEESGIKRVVEAYFKFLPQFDIELVDKDATTYDLKAVHAGMTGSDCDVAHLHGIYWTNDYDSPKWEYDANRRIVEAVRQAKEVTVPSAWVAETFQRDMRFTPHIIGHGIEWKDWQHDYEHQGFILWNKNRIGDVCDPTAINVLAQQFIGNKFVTTFNYDNEHPNVVQTGLLPHSEMKKYIQSAGVYLSTTKETFCIGVLEAMASGVPVLGWRFGGNINLVDHGINGYLAEPHNYEDLAEGLNYCLKNSKVLGDNGREMAKAWTWKKACEKVAGVYRLAMEIEPATISVVIPVYNKSIEQLKRAIESCLNQSLRPEQIVIVDDGSSNDAVGNLELSDFDYEWLTIHRQSNQGVAHARNNGIALTTSKYISCLDSDDYIGPNFLELCVKHLEADDTLGLAYTGLKWFDDAGKSVISEWPGEWNFDRQVNYKGRMNQVPTCNVFRRKVWERLGGFRQRYAPQGAGAEDAEFWTRIGAYGWECKQVEPVPQVLSTYHAVKKQIRVEPTREQIIKSGIDARAYDITMNSLLHYSTGGQVGSNPDYTEVDWLAWHPWAQDGFHPFASYATPFKNRMSHPVRQYDEPMVSVIIPVGPSHEKEVINALDSLEAQTFRKWEVIVVWDNSSYSSDIIMSYPYIKQIFTTKKQLEVIKYPAVNIPSFGAGYARNRGVEIARAPFILFLDADDTLHPDCIQDMLNAYGEYQTGIYTDYVGQAFIDKDLALKLEKENRLNSYTERTQEAIISYQAFDFDCVRALQQPTHNQPYIWNLITTLIPKQWHIDIGGFDEDMETWEDWDYWLRMVHQGHCFTRLEKELVRYRFYTGKRRNKASTDTDEGRQKANSMINSLRDKYKDVEKMSCGCTGKKKDLQQTAVAKGEKMADGDFVKARYMGSRGSHHIIGAFMFNYDPGLPTRKNGAHWKLYYGYAGEGHETLVYKEDVRLMVGKWQEIVEIEPPVVVKVEVPTPQLITATDIPNLVPEEFVAALSTPMPKSIEVEKWQPKLDTPKGGGVFQPSPLADKKPFNLQILPGITPAIAKQLKEKGIDTPEKIQAAGLEGLVAIKGIAESRAKAILIALSE